MRYDCAVAANDIITHALRLVRQLDPAYSRERLETLDWSLRRDYGGRSYYACKKPRAGRVDQRIRDNRGRE